MAKKNLKELAMIDVAEEILKENKQPLTIDNILAKIVEIKGIEKNDFELLNQFYTDMVSSGRFVYCDNSEWDIKENNLEFWDKESYSFTDSQSDDFDDVEDIDFTDFILPEDFEEMVLKNTDFDDEEEEEVKVEDEEAIEENEYIEVELPMISTDDDDVEEAEIEFDDDDFNEDDYDDIMDDYEDMYDE